MYQEQIQQPSWLKSLKTKMIFFMLVVAILPLMVSILIANLLTAKFIRDQAKTNLSLRATSLAKNVTSWDEMNVRMLHTVSNLPDVISMDPEQQLPIFTTVNRLYGDYVFTVEAQTPDGFLVTRGNGQIPDRIQRSDREWFKNALAGKKVSREVVISRSTGRPAVIFSTPIWSVFSLDWGSEGESVVEIQAKLRELGFYQGELDGMYGKMTAEAMINFEKSYRGLPTDGVTDPIAWQLLRQNALIGSEEIAAVPNRKEIIGVANIATFLTALADTVGAVKIGSTGFAFLVNEKGQILAHPDRQFTTGDELTDFSYYPPVKALLNGDSGSIDFVDDWGVRWLSYVVKLENDWGVILVQEEAEVLKPERLFRNLALKIVGISSLVVGCLIWVLANSQIQPLSDLTVAASNLSVGSLTERVNIRRNDELGVLAIAFNIMADRLRELINNLEDKVQERTAELAAANQEITALNQRLKAENIRLVTELEITREIQQMILPKEQELQAISNLDISGYMQPADEVGGDYYDVLQDANGNIKIGIGDVTGHGLESGVLMIMVQTAVRTLLESNQTESKKFLDIINRVLCGNVDRMNSEKNMTLSILDYARGTLKLSGQHEQMILVRHDGTLELIDTIDLGFPIGLDAEIIDFIDESTISLNPEDVVVLYTDGITEAENLDRQQYGLDRLCEVVRSHRHQSAKGIQQAVIKDLIAYIGRQTIYDDITLLVIKQKPLLN